MFEHPIATISLIVLATHACDARAQAAAVPVEREPMHRLVFHNDQVNVLDLLIPPGATTLLHTHRHDLAGLTVSSSPTREEPVGQPATLEPASPEDEAWFEAYPVPSTHRVTNVGDKPVRYVMFELLRAPSAAGDTKMRWSAAAHGKTVVENERVRVIRIDLAPGATAPTHAHAADYGVVLASSGKLQDDGAPPKSFPEAAFVGWKTPSSQHRLRNAGDQPLEILEFEFPALVVGRGTDDQAPGY